MDYHLYVYKEDFDFLNEDLPGNLEWYFGDQLERAREILKHRNLAEIHHALDSLDWILREGGRLEMEHSIAVANEKGHCYVSRVKALKLYAEITDISNQTSLPNATWSVYFAVFTLAYIAEVLDQRNFSANSVGTYSSDDEYSFSLDYIAESVEAICTAECFRQIEQFKPDPNAVMRERGRKGGKIRVKDYDDLKPIVIKHYLEHHQKWPSTHVYNDLKEQIDKVLTGSDKPKTIEKWIGKYHKGTLNIEI